jgi:essential nuclear protein 1
MDSLGLSDQISLSFQNEMSKSFPNATNHTIIDQKVGDLYGKVGLILSRYKSGKLPKALKVIPSMKNWVDLLQLTIPEDWTPNATFQVVKSFVPLLPEALCETFVKLFIFPKILKEFEESRELNVHLYNSVKLIIYKPSSFYKGLVLPLCKEKSFSLKRASIISSIISKFSIPLLSSSAAVILLTKLEFSSPRGLVIKAIVEKNYAFPEKVVFEIVNYLGKVSPNQICVVFFQLLYSLATKYCDTMSNFYVEKLYNLSKKFSHNEMTPLIIEVLQNRLDHAK